MPFDDLIVNGDVIVEVLAEVESAIASRADMTECNADASRNATAA